MQDPKFYSREPGCDREIHSAPGLVAEPAVLEGELAGTSREAFPLRVRATTEANNGTHLVVFDVTLDGKRYGEWFDLIVGVKSE